MTEEKCYFYVFLNKEDNKKKVLLSANEELSLREKNDLVYSRILYDLDFAAQLYHELLKVWHIKYYLIHDVKNDVIRSIITDIEV